MSMVVQHNLSAMNANRQLGITTSAQSKSTEKLSSGYRINRAGDDAAGLTISEKMRSQIRGLNQASTNAQDGVSLIQSAEGALNEAHSILQRMNELAVQGANDTNQSIDRDAINEELSALTEELDRISQTTQFNKQNLLDGSFSGKRLQVGANTNQSISITINSMNAKAIGVKDDIISAAKANSVFTASAVDVEVRVSAATTSNLAVSTYTGVAGAAGKVNSTGGTYIKSTAVSTGASTFTASGLKSMTGGALTVDDYATANKTLSRVQSAINVVSKQRSALGALQNRLEHTIANLDTVSENTSAAESRIRDVDMASEMVEYSKNNILAQAGQSMLAQANQSTQGVLSLLG